MQVKEGSETAMKRLREAGFGGRDLVRSWAGNGLHHGRQTRPRRRHLWHKRPALFQHQHASLFKTPPVLSTHRSTPCFEERQVYCYWHTSGRRRRRRQQHARQHGETAYTVENRSCGDERGDNAVLPSRERQRKHARAEAVS